MLRLLQLCLVFTLTLHVSVDALLCSPKTVEEIREELNGTETLCSGDELSTMFDNGSRVLIGVTGTRFVSYLYSDEQLRCLDDKDDDGDSLTPHFAAHCQDDKGEFVAVVGENHLDYLLVLRFDDYVPEPGKAERVQNLADAKSIAIFENKEKEEGFKHEFYCQDGVMRFREGVIDLNDTNPSFRRHKEGPDASFEANRRHKVLDPVANSTVSKLGHDMGQHNYERMTVSPGPRNTSFYRYSSDSRGNSTCLAFFISGDISKLFGFVPLKNSNATTPPEDDWDDDGRLSEGRTVVPLIEDLDLVRYAQSREKSAEKKLKKEPVVPIVVLGAAAILLPACLAGLAAYVVWNTRIVEIDLDEEKTAVDEAKDQETPPVSVDQGMSVEAPPGDKTHTE
uniref:Expressed conserved protein n=1 Tax=Steinernema glaseri TaxID=37863 RepID=A0A1I7YKF0_9BILA